MVHSSATITGIFNPTLVTLIIKDFQHQKYLFLFITCGVYRFAAEIFHDLHEEVMATATRGHGLMVRVQQLEAEFPPIEKALLSQTNLSSSFYNPG